ncbi:MAG: RNase adapter RapZ [Oscillospiraceae bacterium]|nr:RNase adapter RapZ [Oscillospiraceae bacterium]
MEIVIVTGLSGSGKSRAMVALEDIGYFCIDNMPPQLIPKISEICTNGKNEKLSKVAIATDVRGGDLFYALYDGLDELKKQNISYKILFLDCVDAVLMNRYKETRRKHPLDDGMLGTQSAINAERAMLRRIRESADYIIDTSFLSPSQLKERIISLFLGDKRKSMIVRCVSFGFKYGLPNEADLVFDVRCIPNPFYIDALKDKTGLDESVYDYVMKWPQAQIYEKKLVDMIDYLIPLYIDEGKSQLVIAIGCTGGKHRSVVFSEILKKHISENGINVSVNHRDIDKN